jgi:hypothetical protein
MFTAVDISIIKKITLVYNFGNTSGLFPAVGRKPALNADLTYDSPGVNLTLRNDAQTLENNQFLLTSGYLNVFAGVKIHIRRTR